MHFKQLENVKDGAVVTDETVVEGKVKTAHTPFWIRLLFTFQLWAVR